MLSRGFLSLTILALVCTNAYLYAALFAPTNVQVQHLSVGKGDATLVRLPGGRVVLIDAGPDASILRALGEALTPWQRHLDALILLSSSAGAVGGAPLVLERYRVGELLRSGVQGAPTREAALTATARATRVRITILPPVAELSLHYGSLSLSLASTTPPGMYPVR